MPDGNIINLPGGLLSIPGVGIVRQNGDGTYSDKSGRTLDQWGNSWDPATNKWYNPSGEQWVGTNPGTRTGIFDTPDSYIGTDGKVVGGGDVGGIDFGSLLSGSGRGSDVDHFFDVNPLDQAKFDQSVAQNAWQNDFDTAKFNWDKANADRDYALAVGDQDLARKKQNDANYWQGKTLELEQGNNIRDNQTRIATTQIDANSRIQAASIAAEADRYGAQLRLQEGLANAHNDAERNKVLLAHEQEIANIARMEDETKRAIAAQENRIKAFDAESTRAYQQGDLAIKNNQFILDASKSPRDLFGLFMMQRGKTPDWDRMMAGGDLTQGDPLRVTNPLTAYRPTVMLPTDFAIGNTQMGSVGSAAGGVSFNANPYMNPNMISSSSGGGGGGAGGGSIMSGVTMPNFSQPTNFGQPPKTFSDINPGGLQGGIPVAGLTPGMNLSTVGSDITGADLTMDAFYDQGKTQKINPGDFVAKGTQVWVDYPMPKMNTGGYTNEQQIMTGDANHPNPMAGGARPEIIENPTGAPLRVIPNPLTMKEMGMNEMLDYGIRRYAGGTDLFAPPKTDLFVPPTDTAPRIHTGGVNRGPKPPGGYGFGSPEENIYNPSTNIRPAGPGGFGMINGGGGTGFNGGVNGFSYFNQQQSPQQPQVMPPLQQPQVMPVAQNDLMYQTQAKDRAAQYYQREFNQRYNPSMFNTQALDYGNDNMKIRVQSQPQLGGFLPAYQGAYQRQMPVNQLWNPSPTQSWAMPSPRRYALGTDPNLQAYQNSGMGQLYLQSSQNPGLNPSTLPPGLSGLYNNNVPLPGALVNSVTGQRLPTLNTSNAFNQRGGGVMPSLQTLGRQTQGESELLRGYTEGVIGIPWADFVDYMGKPTQNLQTAKRASGTFM